MNTPCVHTGYKPLKVQIPSARNDASDHLGEIEPQRVIAYAKKLEG